MAKSHRRRPASSARNRPTTRKLSSSQSRGSGHRSPLKDPSEQEKAQFRQQHPEFFVLDRLLADLQTQHSVDPDKVKAILYPKGRGLLHWMGIDLEIQALNGMVTDLEAVGRRARAAPAVGLLKLHGHLHELDGLVAGLRAHLAVLRDEIQETGVVLGPRWGSPISAFLDAEPEKMMAALGSRAGWRQSPFVRRRIAELADLLKQHIPLKRQRAASSGRYGREVLTWTRQLVEHAYGVRSWYAPGLRFSEQDIARRIQLQHTMASRSSKDIPRPTRSGVTPSPERPAGLG